MKRKDGLTIILIFLSLIPFIRANYLASLYTKFMNGALKQDIQSLSGDIDQFRMRQLVSALLTATLFGISLVIAYFFLSLNLSSITWLNIVSTMLLTHSVFAQLGWELRWGGNTLLLETMNEWSFRITYSIGIIVLFLTMVGK
jgi:hypothetical protein